MKFFMREVSCCLLYVYYATKPGFLSPTQRDFYILVFGFDDDRRTRISWSASR